jgi:hypothetical protein
VIQYIPIYASIYYCIRLGGLPYKTLSDQLDTITYLILEALKRAYREPELFQKHKKETGLSPCLSEALNPLGEIVIDNNLLKILLLQAVEILSICASV